MAFEVDDIRFVVTGLVRSQPKGIAGLAHRVGVSPNTVSRWIAGNSRPRPEQEGRLRSLAAPQAGTSNRPGATLDMFPIHESSEDQVREALRATLQDVRGILHRNGRLSSRHEALDELAKLLLAHVVSIDTGGDGLMALPCDSRAGAALRAEVAGAFARFLPRSLSTDLGPTDFAMRIRASESRLCADLIRCFATTLPKDALIEVQRAGQLDILNDAFGQFLADSFIDEKELGQYLTPTNVVRSMVSMGIASLNDSVIDNFLSLSPKADPGLILDPSCGVGSFLAESLRQLYGMARDRLTTDELSHWASTMLNERIVGIDKSERMVRLALTNFALFGAPAVNLHLKNSLARAGREGAFTRSLAGKARLILTNPPFGAEYTAEDLREYNVASSWTARPPKTVVSEVLFVERFIEWLAPGGVLVVVIPDSILTNRGLYRDLRRAIAPRVEILSVVSLPAVTFAAAGTSTKTSILHLRKGERANHRRGTFFAVCNEVGYDVATKSAHRRRESKGQGQLPSIVMEASGESSARIGRYAPLDEAADRWDANYHAGLSPAILERLDQTNEADIVLANVASLSKERTDPRRSSDRKFRYVEISDINSRSCTVEYKWIDRSKAPSRARKVIRPGDVLVSTVRPERRTVGVVGGDIDVGVCTTGLAVLRPRRISPNVLAKLLQSDFATAQILRYNVGIAYPTIDEECLAGILLPVTLAQLKPLEMSSNDILALRSRLQRAEDAFSRKVAAMTSEWPA